MVHLEALVASYRTLFKNESGHILFHVRINTELYVLCFTDAVQLCYVKPGPVMGMETQGHWTRLLLLFSRNFKHINTNLRTLEATDSECNINMPKC